MHALVFDAFSEWLVNGGRHGQVVDAIGIRAVVRVDIVLKLAQIFIAVVSARHEAVLGPKRLNLLLASPSQLVAKPQREKYNIIKRKTKMKSLTCIHILLALLADLIHSQIRACITQKERIWREITLAK